MSDTGPSDGSPTAEPLERGGKGDTLALLGRIAAGIAIGTLGGAVFHLLHMPLPWTLGSMIFTMVAAVARAPIRAPLRLRPALVTVIGVMLGSGFTPDLIGHLDDWAISLGFLVLYLVLAGLLAVPFYQRFGGFDRVTAFCSGMPGGLMEMVTLGADLGGDERKIILAHAARIVVTICLVSFWFRIVEGQAVGSMMAKANPLGLEDIALLTLCGVIGAVAATRLKLPAATLMGPMLLSAVVHVTGLTASAPPALLIIIAQVLMGTIMGCRFLGAGTREVAQALALSFGATVMTLGLTLVFAALFAGIMMQTPAQIVLAYAPGGLTEMSLIALAMKAEVAYVASHHIARIALLVACAPLILTLLERRRTRRIAGADQTDASARGAPGE
ncbi:AbrB family transcriptional regulator [Pannonibacter tanglangensis]|uniref:AbrB family transcriptional regulator n=1 Tax=Pannonibacter tanglangensis TaxID=2750084 RepID=UPI001AD9427B